MKIQDDELNIQLPEATITILNRHIYMLLHCTETLVTQSYHATKEDALLTRAEDVASYRGEFPSSIEYIDYSDHELGEIWNEYTNNKQNFYIHKIILGVKY